MTNALYRFFIIAILFTIASCTKTEIVSGEYKGLATGYFMGTNVNATIRIIRVDDEKVDLNCDFNGYQESYHHASVFKGSNDRYFITEASGVSAIVKNSELNFQFVDGSNAQNTILFTGNK